MRSRQKQHLQVLRKNPQHRLRQQRLRLHCRMLLLLSDTSVSLIISVTEHGGMYSIIYMVLISRRITILRSLSSLRTTSLILQRTSLTAATSSSCLLRELSPERSTLPGTQADHQLAVRHQALQRPPRQRSTAQSISPDRIQAKIIT